MKKEIINQAADALTEFSNAMAEIIAAGINMKLEEGKHEGTFDVCAMPDCIVERTLHKAAAIVSEDLSLEYDIENETISWKLNV